MICQMNGIQCGSKTVYMPGKLVKLRLPLELFHLTTTVTLNLHKTKVLKVAASWPNLYTAFNACKNPECDHAVISVNLTVVPHMTF